MAYTTIDDPSAHFQTTLYTGNRSSSQTITNDGNSDLKPDWLWIKPRNDTVAHSHSLFDSTRGVTKGLATNVDEAEYTTSSKVTSFNTDGFSIGNGASVNQPDRDVNYVTWQWKANGGTTSSNNDGSITVNLQVNQEAGFSIGTYTGTGSQLTLGHGLGAVPKLHITKKLNAADAWNVYHESIGNTHGLRLNNTDAKEDFGFYGDTSPTSSVFTVGGVTNNDRLNTNGGSYIFYSFAEKKGYSKFGSYVGNGSTNGPFVNTGFKPAWLMVKGTSSGREWFMFDGTRDTFNPFNKYVKAESTDAEASSNFGDFCSNGFKVRSDGASYNASGETFIYMAFAEHPFVSSEGVPTTAR